MSGAFGGCGASQEGVREHGQGGPPVSVNIYRSRQRPSPLRNPALVKPEQIVAQVPGQVCVDVASKVVQPRNHLAFLRSGAGGPHLDDPVYPLLEPSALSPPLPYPLHVPVLVTVAGIGIERVAPGDQQNLVYLGDRARLAVHKLLTMVIVVQNMTEGDDPADSAGIGSRAVEVPGTLGQSRPSTGRADKSAVPADQTAPPIGNRYTLRSPDSQYRIPVRNFDVHLRLLEAASPTLGH